jgi:hypothetical protein
MLDSRVCDQLPVFGAARARAEFSMMVLATPPRTKPADTCDNRCSGTPVYRFLPSGKGLCASCYVEHVVRQVARLCPDPEVGTLLVRTLVGMHYPYDQDELFSRVSYWPLKRAAEPDRPHVEQVVHAGIWDALLALRRAGLIVELGGGRVAWTARGVVPIGEPCVGERRRDGREWTW